MSEPDASAKEATDPPSAPPSWAARFFLLRPTFGLLLALLLALGGVMPYFSLVKESVPDLAIPQATVTVFWAGADPQTIEQEVTDPIETEIKTLRGLKKVTSASFDSYSIIAVEFEAGEDMSDAMQRLRSKIDDAQAELPDEADRPTVSQVSVDDRPIMSIVLYGQVGDRTLSRVAEDLQDELERLPGVNEVELGGRREEVVQVQMHPDRMLALGLSPAQVRDAIQSANFDTPWGEIESEAIGATVRLYGRFRDIEDLEQLPVTRLDGVGNGRVVRLGEVAEVRRELETVETRAYFSWAEEDFAPGIEVSIKKVPGSDTIAVIQAVEQAIAAAQREPDWPPAIRYRITQDESEQISDSLTDVFNNAWQAMLAVFIILFVLLTWREGLIAGLCIPLTFLGALIVVWIMGYWLNQLVIIGMVIALGLLVDVFILMMEGLHEGIFVEHQSFGQAAINTVKRYAVPAAAGTATTVLALAPLMAIGGIAGKFIRVLPATAIACLIMAFAVALLVAVPLSRYLLGHVTKKQNRTTRVDRITDAAAKKLTRWTLAVTLRSRWTAAVCVLLAVVVFVVSLLAFTSVPMVMYTKSDGRKLGINIELPPDTSFATSEVLARRIGAILHDEPYFESVVMLVGKKSPFATVGLSDALTPSTGEHFIGFSCMFVEREDRDKAGYIYAEELRERIQKILQAEVAGATLAVVPETGEPSNVPPIQVELTGSDMDQLREISNQVQDTLRRQQGTVGVRDNLGAVRTEINLIPRREAIDFHGLTQQDLATQVRYSMGVGEVGKFALGGQEDDIPIQLSTAWPSRDGGVGGPTRLDELAMVRAYTPDGSTVSLLNLLEPRVNTVPTAITHQDARRSIAVQADTDGTPAATITEQLAPILDAMQDDWPAGYSYRFGGEAEETAETFASAGFMLIIAIVLVFGLLVLLFGSFAQSLIIFATMPLALIGTFLGFYLFNIPFSFFAMVGLISLIGIVVNDTIVMVDTMNRHLRAGLDIPTASARGAADRLRPIISTSLTTIVGLIPLAITNDMWRPLCYAIIIGLLASTLTALVIVPCLYYLFTHKTPATIDDLA